MSLVDLDSKLTVLKEFAENLRLSSNPKCWVLATAVERVLKTGSSEEIETAFEWCNSKYAE